MKIFLISSPRSVAKKPELYKKIYDFLAKENKMLSDLVLKWGNSDTVNDFYNASHNYRVEHYKRTMNCIQKADLVIVELSEHSMSMGYIVNRALEINKPVIALYKKGFEPYFFSGIENQKLQILEYEENNMLDVISEGIEKTKSLIDVRFNFFVSPKIISYLDWVAQKRMVPRSVFIRNLIEREMKKDKEFK
jgi:hypothetical protein